MEHHPNAAPTQMSRRQLAKLAAASALGLSLPIASASAQSAPAEPESTLARVRRTKKLRIAALVGEPPYFSRDPVTKTWAGASVEMAKDIARILDVELEYVDSTYSHSVIQLQTGKVDVAMALTPTPQRALAIDFSHPISLHPYGIVAHESVQATKWADLNNPDMRIAVDVGSTQEMAARRYAPLAHITAFATNDEVMLALQSNTVDCAIFPVLLGLTAVKQNPSIGQFSLLTAPIVGLTSNLAFAKESNTDWRDFLNVWVDYNRNLGQISGWMLESLHLSGIDASDLPSGVVF